MQSSFQMHRHRKMGKVTSELATFLSRQRSALRSHYDKTKRKRREARPVWIFLVLHHVRSKREIIKDMSSFTLGPDPLNF